ncbi:MAG: phosphoribosylformylglycinamidine synthase subunit PurL [Chloroflexi bacterium]|nr:phosphoribosylformylglycinamidine synthase subunit PurL [Chloroflexota bacterium]
MPPDQRTLDQLSLSREEYDRIVDLLDREPTEVELGMFGALWSEHCGYKNSRPLLKMFPTDGDFVLTKAGEENAGVVDIGSGLGVAFKIESHNHPSAIEPYEGAATGVGGIVRDIFAMGARPMALLDSLRFGPLQAGNGTSEQTAAHNRRLFGGVVSGIGGYGNCIGIPTVGGEVSFSPSYSGNPLVNAMCVGIGEVQKLVKARADGPGNLLMLVGADTGRDGIHGATFASVQLDESSEGRRPAVQVGNPFLEKLLMEACLQLTEEHGDWIVGLQDLGAAGLTSSSVECAAKAGTGIIIDVAKVPRREEGMTAYEVMLSESQERMLVIVKPQHEEDVRGLFEHWELHCATIGIVTDDGLVRIRDGAQEVACVAAPLMTEAPTYVRDGDAPRWMEDLQRADLAPVLEGVGDTREMLLRLLASPDIASKRTVWRQYDHQVGTNTVAGPGGDAAVLRVKGTTKGVAMCTDGNAAFTLLDPYAGGAMAVAEAARNVACTGARPVAMTNCLNFGNPEKPEQYFQLREAIRGMADAARALDLPVVSGNVSLYNETNGEAIWPTPVVGVVGLIEDVDRAVGMAFPQEGLDVLLASPAGAQSTATTGLAGSQVATAVLGHPAGRPEIDLEGEARVQRFLLRACDEGLIASAHDIAAGGLAVAAARCALAGDVGATLSGVRGVAELFGEPASRVLLTTDARAALEALAEAHGVSLQALGRTGGDALSIDGVRTTLEELREAYEGGLPRALEGVVFND